jgi:hypothetical protein
LSSWRMYEMHLASFLKAGCDSQAPLLVQQQTVKPPVKYRTLPTRATFSVPLCVRYVAGQQGHSTDMTRMAHKQLVGPRAHRRRQRHWSMSWAHSCQKNIEYGI